MAATGLGFATISRFWPLLVVAFVGTLNPSSGDVSVFLPLEHAMLAQLAPDRQRTAWFARYSLVGALLGAAGALVARACRNGSSARHTALSMHGALQAMFVLYALLGVASALVYRRLPAGPARRAGTQGARRSSEPSASSTRSRRCSASTRFGGGFIVQSMLALWLFERFALSTATAGAIFFWTGVFSALSYLVAVRIANRIGLVNTMVFTHLPSNVLLILVPFAPDLDDVHRAAARAQRAVADGRADAKLVRDGGRAARRARGRGERDVGAAQPRVGDQSAPRRLPARHVELRLAAGHRRRAEDRLRPAAAGVLPRATRASADQAPDP